MKKILAVLTLCLWPSLSFAFPDNGVLESFTGADTTTPPNANWTNGVEGTVTGKIRIYSNGATTDVNGVTGDAYYNASSASSTGCEAYATITAPSLSFAYVFCSLKNIGSNTTDGYAATINSTNGLKLKRIDNGAETDLWGPSAQALGAGDKWGIKVSGGQICHWYKTAAGAWTQMQCVADATYTADGNMGIGVNGNNAAAAIDDFGGGTIASSATDGLKARKQVRFQ